MKIESEEEKDVLNCKLAKLYLSNKILSNLVIFTFLWKEFDFINVIKGGDDLLSLILYNIFVSWWHVAVLSKANVKKFFPKENKQCCIFYKKDNYSSIVFLSCFMCYFWLCTIIFILADVNYRYTNRSIISGKINRNFSICLN